MRGLLYLSIALFFIVITIFITNNDFFDSMYNSKIGRLVLVTILIVITLNSLALAILLLIIIMILSQNKKKVVIYHKADIKEEKERLPLSEALYKSDRDVHSEKFIYKKYKTTEAYKKSKRRDGVNIIKASEALRPKPSGHIPLFPNDKNAEIIPFSDSKTYYNV